MCQSLTASLLSWRDDPAVQAVLIDHSGERGFCAGGDIRMLAESGAGDGKAARLFFHTEYRLNHLLFVYPKPVIAVMDGVTMGGGVGLSMPASIRIATERTTFAMPETGIGLFPDVGGGWFLPRLPGRAGLWLALTGARIKAADCCALGIATHFMPSDKVEAFKAALLAHPDALAEALATCVEDAGHPPLAAHQADIDRLFDGDSVQTILDRLQADGGEWATAQLATLATKSPQTLKVAFRQLAHGAALTDFADNMAMEYRIGARVVAMHDFLEGVRAVIIDKDNAPKWSPPTVEEVSDTVLDDIFAPLPADQDWTPLT
jgi:enoyl-CoA hydratase